MFLLPSLTLQPSVNVKYKTNLAATRENYKW